MATHKIHIYYGAGKGKTTAAIGLAIRAAGANHNVMFIQFDKGFDGENEHYAERHILRTIKNIDINPTGCERVLTETTFRFENEENDFKEAKRGLQFAFDAISNKSHDLIILDEILASVMTGLLEKSDVMALLDHYEKNDRPAELILTGHKVWRELKERVDLITEMKKVKHYFDQGQYARKGIEF